MEPCNRESSTHCEEQGRDGSAACHMNHGQQTGEVALSGSGEEQSAKGEGQTQWTMLARGRSQTLWRKQERLEGVWVLSITTVMNLVDIKAG